MQPTFLVIDLFCGAGGVTTGFAMAGPGVVKVIACVNHDPKAIESHWKNHPEVLHFEEDIRTLDTKELVECLEINRRSFPEAKVILWASLECTNFSKAKGGLPRDGDSRTLADHLHRYVEALDPDFVQIENVTEFRSWGPLDENGKPISKQAGIDFVRWCREMDAHGYTNEWKELNSADFGAYTSRNRLFGCFAKPGLPVMWPEPTHTRRPEKFPDTLLKKWMPVKHVLDFSDEGKSIFERKKPLSEKTLQRIYAGLIKYVAGMNQKTFIQKYYSGRPEGKVISIEGPAGTIRCSDGQALITANFLLKYTSMDKNGVHTPPSVEEPAPVIAAQARLGLVQPQFLTHYYGMGGTASSLDVPGPTIPTKARTGIIATTSIQSVEQPAGTILTNDKHRLVQTIPFVLNPSHGGHSTSADAPCPVIVARQDKAPLYIVQAEAGGPVAVAVYEDDSETTILIKQFMVLFNIIDIKMRMLKIIELLRIQGFPAETVLLGTQADQKKFIGNSVVPKVVKVWIETLNIAVLQMRTEMQKIA